MQIMVALAQMAVAYGNPEENLRTARSQAAQAAAQGADLLILPELWPTGYDLDRADVYAAPLDQGAFAQMAELAATHQMYVLGTALERNPAGRPYNTAALYGPDGRRSAAYHKVHLFPPLGEVEHMAPGEALPVFDLPWGRTAIAICYDLRFPEMWRRYRAAGAELVLIPAEWPDRRVEHWRLFLRARALENQLFVAGCNRAGSDVDGSFGGYSGAVDPWGRVVAECGSEPGLVLAALDLDEVARCRRLFPWFEDRRPDVYGFALRGSSPKG
jgi:predicted amidohydrolase